MTKTKNSGNQERYQRNGPGMSDLALKHLSNNYKTLKLNNAVVNRKQGKTMPRDQREDFKRFKISKDNASDEKF